MLRAKADERVYRREPLRDRLLRQPHHEVQRDVLKSRLSRHFERLAGARGGMQSAQTLELVVAKGLDTETEAIDSRVAKCPQPVAGDGLGIGFERDLGGRSQSKGIPAFVDDALHLGWFEQGRRAPSEENRIRRGSVCLPTYFGEKSAEISALEVSVEQTTVEVAVVADGRAEGNVNVEPEHAPTANRRGPLAISSRPCRRSRVS